MLQFGMWPHVPSPYRSRAESTGRAHQAYVPAAAPCLLQAHNEHAPLPDLDHPDTVNCSKTVCTCDESSISIAIRGALALLA